MATKYNYNAQRSQDVIVTVTPKQPDRSWDTVSEQKNPPWVHSLPIDDTAPKITPRIIRVELDAVNRVAWDANSIDFMLNLPQIGKVMPGSVLYWRSIESNQTEVVDWAIMGLQSHTYNLGGPNYALRGRFLSAGTNSWSPNVGVLAPLAVTLKNNEDMFFNRRISIVRIGATGTAIPNIANIFFRTQLILVEPGAHYV